MQAVHEKNQTKMTKIRNILCVSDINSVSATSVAHTGKHLCPQQCVLVCHHLYSNSESRPQNKINTLHTKSTHGKIKTKLVAKETLLEAKKISELTPQQRNSRQNLTHDKANTSHGKSKRTHGTTTKLTAK